MASQRKINMCVLPGARRLREAGGGLALILEGDHLPGITLGQQLAQQEVVHGVARAESAVRSQQGLANEVQVAHGVQDLVLHELVVVAQAVLVQHAVIVEAFGPREQRGGRFEGGDLGVKRGEIARENRLVVQAYLLTVLMGLTDAVSEDHELQRRAIQGIKMAMRGQLVTTS